MNEAYAKKKLKVEIYQNESLIEDYFLADKEDLLYGVEMYDDKYKFFSIEKQIEALLNSSSLENTCNYRLYATFFKWGNTQEDERFFTVKISKKI